MLAEQHSTRWCCDCHSDSGFNLSTFFLGEVFTQVDSGIPTETKRKHTQYRAKEDRAGLFNTLLIHFRNWQRT